MILRMLSITRMKKLYVCKIIKIFINMIKSKVHLCLNKSCICLPWLLNENIWNFWEFIFYLENWVYDAKNIIQVLIVKDWLMCNVKPCFNKYHICHSRVHFLISSYQSSHTLRLLFFNFLMLCHVDHHLKRVLALNGHMFLEPI